MIKQLLSFAAMLFLCLGVVLGFWAGQTWGDASAQESRTYGQGWVNMVYWGDTESPDEALGAAGDSVAAVYYLDNATGAWLRHFPGRSGVSSLTTMIRGEPYLVLLTEDATVTGGVCDTSPPQDCPSPEADCGDCQSDLGACQSDLGATQSDLGICQSDLGATQSDLGICQSDLGACGAGLSAAQSDLGTCQSDLGACQTSLSTCTDWQDYICSDLVDAIEAGHGDSVILGIYQQYCL